MPFTSPNPTATFLLATETSFSASTTTMIRTIRPITSWYPFCDRFPSLLAFLFWRVKEVLNFEHFTECDRLRVRIFFRLLPGLDVDPRIVNRRCELEILRNHHLTSFDKVFLDPLFLCFYKPPVLSLTVELRSVGLGEQTRLVFALRSMKVQL